MGKVRRPVAFGIVLASCVIGVLPLWTLRPTPSPADMGIPLPPGAHVVSHYNGITRNLLYRSWELNVSGISVEDAARFYETRMPAAGYPVVSNSGLFRPGEAFTAFQTAGYSFGPFERSVDFEVSLQAARTNTIHITIGYSFRWNPL